MAKNLTIHPDENKDLTIEVVSAHKDFRSAAKEAAFMEEIVTVFVHPSASESDPPHFILNVNGVNQPVMRGVPTKMKRKYVEVLARMKEIKYSQPPMNMMNPEASNAVIPRTAQVYPFEIMDDTGIGRAWCNAILSEAA